MLGKSADGGARLDELTRPPGKVVDVAEKVQCQNSQTVQVGPLDRSRLADALGCNAVDSTFDGWVAGVKRESSREWRMTVCEECTANAKEFEKRLTLRR